MINGACMAGSVTSLSNNDSFIHAASRGDIEAVKALLRLPNNININTTNNDGCTALMLAAHNGHPEVVRLLLTQRHIDLNVYNLRGETALMLADTRNHNGIVRLLLLRGANTKTGRTIQNIRNGNSILVMLARSEADGSIDPQLAYNIVSSPRSKVFSERMAALQAAYPALTYEQFLEHNTAEQRDSKQRLQAFFMGRLFDDRNHSMVRKLPIDILGIIAANVIRPDAKALQTRPINLRR